MPINEHQNQDVVVRTKKLQPFSSYFQLNSAFIEACCIGCLEPRSHNILPRVINWNLSAPGPLWLVVERSRKHSSP